MSTPKKSPAIDLSHHLSAQSNARIISPLKGLQKYLENENIISVAGGMPDPSYFPFSTITVDALIPEEQSTKTAESSLFSWFWSLFGADPGSAEKTQRFSVHKYPAQSGDINLAAALQYSAATGLPQLRKLVHDFTDRVYQPAYADFQTLVSIGNTDGINRSIATLCNPGEQILVEEWTYPSMIASARPLGVLPAPVKVDGEGLSCVDLERVLSGWDETSRGAKRPHVLYTVPIGQNPTGSTMGLERKKAIYAICVKYDVIIIEDDPYYFLQEGTWSPKGERGQTSSLANPEKHETDSFFHDAFVPNTDLEKGLLNSMGKDKQAKFIKSLTPSFVKVDYQGRVIRLDSFSKIIAPGSRLGWMTANPKFIERLERQGESTTQAPCGLSQSLITQLITKAWGLDNFLIWLQGLQKQYTARRDFFVDAIFEAFEVRRNYDPAVVAEFGNWKGNYVYTAYPRANIVREKSGGEKPRLFSFIPPSSGMFVWLKIHVQDMASGKQTTEEKLWQDIAEHGLLVSPGWFFSGATPDTAKSQATKSSTDVHLRLAYSMGKREELKKALAILAKVLTKYIVN